MSRFCGREGVSIAAFHYWRRKCQVAEVNSEPPRAQFAPVEVVHAGSVTIRFPGGAVMESPEPREALLRAVIGALAGGSGPDGSDPALVGSIGSARPMAVVGAHPRPARAAVSMRGFEPRSRL